MSDEKLRGLARAHAINPADGAARDRYEDELARAGRGVFLVWAGSYSDKHVVGAYTSRAKAQAVVAAGVAHDQGPNRLLFCDLDEHRSGTRFRGCWTVEINGKGEVEDTQWVSYKRARSPAFSMTPDSFEGCGETPEDARRSAEELRRVTLAEEALRG